MGASERDSDACPVSAYEGGDDAYQIFRKMLDSGHPPGDWDQLLSVPSESSPLIQRQALKLDGGVVGSDEIGVFAAPAALLFLGDHLAQKRVADLRDVEFKRLGGIEYIGTERQVSSPL